MERVFVLPAQRSVQAKPGYYGSNYPSKSQSRANRGASCSMVVPGALVLKPPSVEGRKRPQFRPQKSARRRNASGNGPSPRGGASGATLDSRLHAALTELKSIKEAVRTQSHEHSEMEAGRPGGTREREGSAVAAGTTSALQQRLSVAEQVMRKLYKQNQRLREKLKTHGAERASSAGPGRPSTAGSSLTVVAPPEDLLAPLFESQRKAEEHLAFVLAERERTIEELRQRVAKLESEFWSMKLQQRQKLDAATQEMVGDLQRELETAKADSRRFRTMYERLAKDHRKLVQKRMGVVTRTTVFSEHADAQAAHDQVSGLMQALRRRVTNLERERALEVTTLNSKLSEAERKTCDWYVEKRLLEDKVKGLSREVQRRDALEEKIEACVHALFQRLQQVEADNVALRHQLELATGTRVGSSGTDGVERERGKGRSGGDDGDWEIDRSRAE
mmetsp:Transcript_11310/g.36128  ORF Transcript_11310/g.36128 Transcript_11310/m.36128 type:complete len:447 (+) Transcript_11310:3-1343(+)